jgi:histidinol-phosphate phosphatase family protein
MTAGDAAVDMARHANTRPAVFLDRDGTIIEDRGDLSDLGQVVFFGDAVPALRRLAGRFALFIVTNQSGVSKGTIGIEDAHRVNRHVEACLAARGVSITATYCCPHQRSSGCRCIKPNPHFLREAERDHRIDLARSFTVGDHPHDVEFARRVGATGIYVLTGHGTRHRHEVPADELVVDGIGDAADLILSMTAGRRGRGGAAVRGRGDAGPGQTR